MIIWTYIQCKILFIQDIDEEEIWEDFLKLVAYNVETHSCLSTFNIALLLTSPTSPNESSDDSCDSRSLSFDQVIWLSIYLKNIWYHYGCI